MAKSKKSAKKPSQQLSPEQQAAFDKLPKDAQAKLKAIKQKLDKFQKQVLEKFEDYIMGISLLPPPKKENVPENAPEEEKLDKDKINVLVLVDDSDSKKMPKAELKSKLTEIIAKVGSDIDKNIQVQTVILSELWQHVYDAKYDLLQLIALGAPIFDKGMLAAIKIAEVHKTMVLKKFEKYIVSYVLAGSLVQGRATPTSDIDVWIVIDDTDVKKMTRVELKDKLRAIIIGMGMEAGELTGIRNKLNIQVYILTDFWDSLREANPIIFTLLRDGVPFYDTGIFMPWKHLLQMGKIKPSAEAIDMFMGSGEQMLRRVEAKLKDIGMEDIYYSILTPSQAALMMHGIPPPAPKETAELMREIFVKKEKLLEDKYVKTLEHVIATRKTIEHGDKKSLTGKELDEMLKNADSYLKRIKRLFTQIERMKEQSDMGKLYDAIITVTRDVLKSEGIENLETSKLPKLFDTELIAKGNVPHKFLKSFNEVVEAKKLHDQGKLNKVDSEAIKKTGSELMKFMIEYVQRKRGKELERAKIRFKYGDVFGEVLLLDKTAFIIADIDAEDKDVQKAAIKTDGSLGPVQKSDLPELEHALSSTSIPAKVFIKQPIFDDLRNLFGKDVEVLINY